MIVYLEYIWIDGTFGLRSKTKIVKEDTLNYNLNMDIEIIPKWNYDGSSTN